MKAIRAEELLDRKVSRFRWRKINETFFGLLAQGMPGRGPWDETRKCDSQDSQ